MTIDFPLLKVAKIFHLSLYLTMIHDFMLLNSLTYNLCRFFCNILKHSLENVKIQYLKIYLPERVENKTFRISFHKIWIYFFPESLFDIDFSKDKENRDEKNRSKGSEQSNNSQLTDEILWKSLCFSVLFFCGKLNFQWKKSEKSTWKINYQLWSIWEFFKE